MASTITNLPGYLITFGPILPFIETPAWSGQITGAYTHGVDSYSEERITLRIVAVLLRDNGIVKTALNLTVRTDNIASTQFLQQLPSFG